MSVYYEWDIEEIDEFEDIIDHDFQYALADFYSEQLGSLANESRYRLVLVRNVYAQDDEGDLIDRDWAYAERGDDGLLRMPGRFGDYGNGAKVPKRFHEELAKWQKRGAA